MSGPRLLPRRAPGTPRQVYLPKEMWERLKLAAKFHSDVFKRMGSTEGVSRNDLIEDWLDWAEGMYWEQVGGPPTSPKDREAKLEKMAAILEAKQAEAEK